MSNNRRRYTRVPFKVKAEVTISGSGYTVDKINDLAVGGCLLPIAEKQKIGAHCEVRIILSGTSSELSVKAAGEIVRSDPQWVAIKFTQVDDDSFFHLQNIVRYNSSDPDMIEKEILDHPILDVQ